MGNNNNNEQTLPQDVDGFEYVTNALMATVNQFPGLEEGETFSFSMIPTEEGLSIIASSGSFIYQEQESIIGHVWQTCLYPFTVVYRASGLNQTRKIAAKEWLDNLGRWLVRQPITINGTNYVLSEWPKLTGDREIRNIIRQTPAFLGNINEDKSENWVMDMQIQYRNEFDR